MKALGFLNYRSIVLRQILGDAGRTQRRAADADGCTLSFDVARTRNACDGKADIARTCCHVSFWSKADIITTSHGHDLRSEGASVTHADA